MRVQGCRICTRPQSQFNNIQLKICVNKNQLAQTKTQQKLKEAKQLAINTTPEAEQRQRSSSQNKSIKNKITGTATMLVPLCRVTSSKKCPKCVIKQRSVRSSRSRQSWRRLSRAGAAHTNSESDCNSCTFDFALHLSSNVGVVISLTHTHTHNPHTCIMAPRFIHAFFSTFAGLTLSLSLFKNLSFPCSRRHTLTHSLTLTHTHMGIHPFVPKYERALA